MSEFHLRSIPRESSVSRLGLGGLWAGLMLTLTLVSAGAARGQEIEQAPINYSRATPRNPVEQLRDRLMKGSATLEAEPVYGYLRPLLRELGVPESSQVLVFSKTSLQRDRISPRAPRAIYFNDEVTVGYCRRGGVLEISSADETIGTAFYTLNQTADVDEVEEADARPVPRRQTEACLTCHGSSANRGYPGHLVRSLYVDRTGEPLFSRGSFHTDHESPLTERWGGWYVTGTSGRQAHLGNLITRESETPEEPVKGTAGVNVVDLKGRFESSAYLTPHSDIVALMVLEHQVGMLNRIARASIETRMALHYQHELNKALGQPLDERSDSAWSRIRGVGDAVARYLLFAGEIRLTDRVVGTSSFAADFARRGPRDSKGRSLRDFDLETRLFRYPCSYLIYSRAFDSLPTEVKEYTYQRLWEILNGRGGPDDPKLAEADGRAILEILRETKPGLPDSWKQTEALPRSR